MDKLHVNRKNGILVLMIKTICSILILASGVAVFVVLFLSREKPANRPTDLLIPVVETYEAQPYLGSLDLAVSGTVVPFKEIKLATEVGGKIARKMPECDAGRFVSKGTVLIEIDREPYDIEVKTLDAEVSQSRTAITEAEQELRGLEDQIAISTKDLELQKNEFERNRSLKGVVSNSEMDQSQRAYLNAQSQLSTLKNNAATATARINRLKSALDLSQRKLEKVTLNLSKTTIVAPEDGVVVKENVEEGDFVPAGTALVTFEDTARSEVICNLTYTDVNWIKQNARAESTEIEPVLNEAGGTAYALPHVKVKIFDARNPEIVWDGILDRYDGIGLDQMTKTIPVRVVVLKPVVETPKGPRALVRGMFVKCQIEVQSDQDSQKLLSFPAKALRPGDVVWTANDRKLQRHKVTAIDQVSATPSGTNQAIPMTVIKLSDDGIQPGDLVVISPLSQPTVGSDVVFTTDKAKDNQTDSANASKPNSKDQNSSIDGSTDESKPDSVKLGRATADSQTNTNQPKNDEAPKIEPAIETQSSTDNQGN